MKLNHACLRAALLIVALTHASILTLRADHAPRAVLSDGVVDLRTTEGVARVKAQWRYSDTRINEIDVEAFQIVDGRLLLQYSKGVRNDFNKDTKGNLGKADANWPALLEKKGK